MTSRIIVIFAEGGTCLDRKLDETRRLNKSFTEINKEIPRLQYIDEIFDKNECKIYTGMKRYAEDRNKWTRTANEPSS